MILLDSRQNYFAMTEFLESYYWASKDDSLGDILGSLTMWRNDNELIDPATMADWNKFFCDVNPQKHTLLEGFQTVKQFVNEYLADSEYYTDLTRNLTYTIRKDCDGTARERESSTVWTNWVDAAKWIINPAVMKIQETPFVDSNTHVEVGKFEERFPVAKILPPPRPVIGGDRDNIKISVKQNYFIMMKFLAKYAQEDGDNQDIQRIFTEFPLIAHTQTAKNNWRGWNDYFVDVSHKKATINILQALCVVSEFMQVEVPDNALHSVYGRQLTRNIWNTIYMTKEAREATQIWKNWKSSVVEILKL